MAIQAIYPFTSASDYVYDAALVDVAGGVGVLKALALQTNEQLSATFWTSKDSDRALSSVTNTINGTASWISSGGIGYIDCRGAGLAEYLSIPVANLTGITTAVCIRFKITPDYTGNPAASRHIYSESTADGVGNGQISLLQKTNGQIELTLANAAGGTLFNGEVGAWSAVSGTEAEFELNVEYGTAYYFYINGTRMSTSSVGARNAPVIGVAKLGGSLTAATGRSSALFRDLVIYNAVQHTGASYTSPIAATIYSVDNPTIVTGTPISTTGITIFDSSITLLGSDLIKFAVRVSSTDKYWNGSAWATSTSYAQSNTLAEIITNITTLTISGNYVFIVAYLHSENGKSAPPQISSITLDYNFDNPGETVNKCLVYGSILDLNGEPVVNAKIQIDSDDFYYSNAFIAKSAIVYTNDEGEFTMNIVETESRGLTVKFTITYQDINGTDVVTEYENIEIPNQILATFESLVS